MPWAGSRRQIQKSPRLAGCFSLPLIDMSFSPARHRSLSESSQTGVHPIAATSREQTGHGQSCMVSQALSIAVAAVRIEIILVDHAWDGHDPRRPRWSMGPTIAPGLLRQGTLGKLAADVPLDSHHRQDHPASP